MMLRAGNKLWPALNFWVGILPIHSHTQVKCLPKKREDGWN